LILYVQNRRVLCRILVCIAQSIAREQRLEIRGYAVWSEGHLAYAFVSTRLFKITCYV
jgi:hypothetical protein